MVFHRVRLHYCHIHQNWLIYAQLLTSDSSENLGPMGGQVVPFTL